MATSSAVFFFKKPPTPQYMSSVFSRTTTKSMSFGPLSLSGVSTPGKKLHRAQVDVLIELKAQFQQQAFFQDARRHVGMADRAQVHGVEGAQLVDGPAWGGFRRCAGSGHRRSRKSVELVLEVFELRDRGLRTFKPSAATSGPVPSPPITAIFRFLLLTKTRTSTAGDNDKEGEPGKNRRF